MSLRSKLGICILGLIVLAAGFFVVRGVIGGVQVTAAFPPAGQAVGAFGKVGFTFQQAMNTKEVEELIQTNPSTPGSLSWEGNTVWFTPQTAWQPGVEHHLRLLAGASALDGRKVLHEHTVAFRVRQPEILYLSTQENRSELWSVPADGGPPHRLSAAGADVYDFAPARDGERVVYSLKNSGGGLDLWLINRDGSRDYLLIDCGADRCSQPAWSPDGKHLVYHREVAQRGSAATTGVWTADPNTGQTDYIFPGANPSFSPDGNQLVTMESGSADGAAGAIHILDVRTGKGIELQADTGILPTWLPDSSKMIYANLQPAGELANVALFQVEISTRRVSRLLDQLPGDAQVSTPAVAPDGKTLLIGIQEVGGSAAEQLYVMDLDGSHSQRITNDSLYNNASYSWDPWGTRAVYQQLQLGVSGTAPQVMVWDRQTGKSTLVIDHAALPRWLP